MMMSSRQQYLHNIIKTNMNAYTMRLNAMPNDDLEPQKYINELTKIQKALKSTCGFIGELIEESKGDLKHE